MILSWQPVVYIDILGSTVTLFLAIFCAKLSYEWSKEDSSDTFRHYILLLTFAIAFFAVSRSFGHLLKHILLFNQMGSTWKLISPFSGAINTVAFVLISAFGLSFDRAQKAHREIKKYENELEEMIAQRTSDLETVNTTFENVFNSSNPISITNLNYEVIQANQAYYEVWPREEGVPKGTKCYDLRPGTFCQNKNCPVQKITSGSDKAQFLRLRHNDDEETDFLVSARPYRDKDGQLIGIVKNYQDITDLRAVESELASERERLAVTLRSIGDGVIATDLTGNIVLLNKVAEELTGWLQVDSIDKPIQTVFDIIDEETGLPRVNPVGQVIESGGFVEAKYPTILRNKNGSQCAIEDSAAPIFDSKGELMGVVLVFRDVGEARKTAQELLKAKKLESVGVLAGGIAHDFNNMLAAILGNIELAGMQLDPSQDPFRLLEEAKHAVVRAKSLTQQLLTFSKGGHPIKRAAPIGETVIESASFVLRGSSVACSFNIPDDLPLVDIDTGQMGQVIHNLVLNAKMAMPDGGKIIISCEKVMDSTSETPTKKPEVSAILITVEDNGCGIPRHYIDKIFDPYFTTKEEGSGLGLAITHSIITKHDGSLTVHSKEGVGTTFSITLPVTSEEQHVEISDPQNPKFEPALILVMDDERLILDLTDRMLSHAGHSVLLAEDGDEAIEILKSQHASGSPVDVIIMDLTIPGRMGGKDAIVAIRKFDPEVKAIVASGYSNDPVMANFKDYGFSAAIAKPFLFGELTAILQDLLET